MLGDKILFKPEHYIQASDVISKLDRNKKKKVVLIGGSSGTGKTETAMLIREELYKFNMSSLIISLDDYYNTHWKERDEIRKKKGINKVGCSEIKWSVLKDIIDNFRNDKPIIYYRVNKFSNQDELLITESDFKVLIIEGLYALKLKDLADTVHHIEGTPAGTYKFRKERRKENPDDDWRREIVTKEHKEVMRLKERL